MTDMRVTHGHTKSGNTRTYRIWSNMKTRCRNPKASNYAFYGARGITVCDRWLQFVNFLADMGEAPEAMTLDRVDGSKGYNPENCRWLSHKEQCRNRRNNRMVELKGERFPASVLAERAGVELKLFCGRLDRGWAVERAMTRTK